MITCSEKIKILDQWKNNIILRDIFFSFMNLEKKKVLGKKLQVS